MTESGLKRDEDPIIPGTTTSGPTPKSKMDVLSMPLLYEIIRYEPAAQFSLLCLKRSLSDRFTKQPEYLHTLIEDLYDSSFRELNFDTCLKELESLLRNANNTHIVYFVESTKKVHIYDIKLGTVSAAVASIPAEKFPLAAAWVVLKNGNFFYTGGATSGYQTYAWEINRRTYTAKEHTPMLESR